MFFATAFRERFLVDFWRVRSWKIAIFPRKNNDYRKINVFEEIWFLGDFWMDFRRLERSKFEQNWSENRIFRWCCFYNGFLGVFDRFWTVRDASRGLLGRPASVPNASRSVLGRPGASGIDFWTILDRFLMDFLSISDYFLIDFWYFFTSWGLVVVATNISFLIYFRSKELQLECAFAQIGFSFHGPWFWWASILMGFSSHGLWLWKDWWALALVGFRSGGL